MCTNWSASWPDDTCMWNQSYLPLQRSKIDVVPFCSAVRGLMSPPTRSPSTCMPLTIVNPLFANFSITFCTKKKKKVYAKVRKSGFSKIGEWLENWNLCFPNLSSSTENGWIFLETVYLEKTEKEDVAFWRSKQRRPWPRWVHMCVFCDARLSVISQRPWSLQTLTPPTSQCWKQEKLRPKELSEMSSNHTWIWLEEVWSCLITI